MPISYCTTHARAALIHALRRAYERYKVELTEFDIFRMSDLILQGKAQQKQRMASRVAYKLNYQGKNFVLVFDLVLNIIVTFLPRKALKRWS
jgi:hypothetical protein